jgi:hypothetical protein
MMYRWLLGIALLAAVVGGSVRWYGNQKQTAYDAGYATCDAAVTKEAFKATEKARAKEAVLIDRNQRVTNDYKAENERLRAESDDTRRLLDSLQAAASSASDTNTGSIGGIADPYPRAFVECAGALTEVDKEYQRVRGVAQSLQRYASEVCVNN